MSHRDGFVLRYLDFLFLIPLVLALLWVWSQHTLPAVPFSWMSFLDLMTSLSLFFMVESAIKQKSLRAFRWILAIALFVALIFPDRFIFHYLGMG